MKGLSYILETVIWPFTAPPLVKLGSPVNNRHTNSLNVKCWGFHDTV